MFWKYRFNKKFKKYNKVQSAAGSAYPAYAKVNLGLDVVRKRSDGYHDVSMIMQGISLCDRLVLIPRTDNKIKLYSNSKAMRKLELKKNLCYKAAKSIQDRYNTSGVDIYLDKHIPAAAGMAGGSTDAAAVIRCMNKIFSLKLNLDDMQKLAVKLGADIPFCLQGGTALAEGVGEKLTALRNIPKCYILTATPDIEVSTKEVYEGLNLNKTTIHPDIDGLRKAINTGKISEICKKMENLMEISVSAKYHEIKDIEEIMLDKGAEVSIMSGSGPTVYGIFERKGAAKQAMKAICEVGLCKKNRVFISEPQVIN